MTGWLEQACHLLLTGHMVALCLRTKPFGFKAGNSKRGIPSSWPTLTSHTELSADIPTWEGALHLQSSSLQVGESNGTPLQYSCLENPTDGGAWWATVHGVAKSWTWLSDFTFTFHFHALQKEMATHSSVLDWRIPGTGEPGGLPSMGSHRVGHDWSDLAAAAAVCRSLCMHSLDGAPWLDGQILERALSLEGCASLLAQRKTSMTICWNELTPSLVTHRSLPINPHVV